MTTSTTPVEQQATAAAKLIERWESLGVSARAGCTEERLAAFEAWAGGRIPADLRDLLARANGADTDPEGFRFWPVEDYAPADGQAGIHGYDDWPRIDGDGSYFVFCDYMQWSWAYAIRLDGSGDAEPGGRVVPVGMNEMFTVAGSFSEFVDLYLADSPRLYPPDPES